MTDPYMELAKPLNAACPPGFERAWIEAEVGDDWNEQTAWCQAPSGTTQPVISASDSFQMGRAFQKLRHDMTRPGEAAWSHCTFTLFPDGKFKLDVRYDD